MVRPSPFWGRQAEPIAFLIRWGEVRILPVDSDPPPHYRHGVASYTIDAPNEARHQLRRSSLLPPDSKKGAPDDAQFALQRGNI